MSFTLLGSSVFQMKQTRISLKACRSHTKELLRVLMQLKVNSKMMINLREDYTYGLSMKFLVMTLVKV